jgi:hypothetical protein
MYRCILSQLIDADEFKALSPEELRDLVLKLDEEIVYGTSEVIEPRAETASSRA